MLIWIFGGVQKNIVHLHTHDRAAGFLQLQKARVRWFLSINESTLPTHIKEKGQRTYRSLTMEGQEIEFSEGFTDLHTRSYEAILAGNGFNLIEACLPSNGAYYQNTTAYRSQRRLSPIGRAPLATHPFAL